MSEIANCPVCGKEPTEAGAIENGVFITENVACCDVWCGTVDAWNRYSAAMELSQLEVKFENCKSEDEHKYQEMIEWAKKHILEVFK